MEKKIGDGRGECQGETIQRLKTQGPKILAFRLVSKGGPKSEWTLGGVSNGAGDDVAVRVAEVRRSEKYEPKKVLITRLFRKNPKTEGGPGNRSAEGWTEQGSNGGGNRLEGDILGEWEWQGEKMAGQ